MREEFKPYVKPCRGCGKSMIWALDSDGKKIPLDPRAVVYNLRLDEDQGEIVADRTDLAMVNHFATCSEANTMKKKTGSTPIGGQ